MLLALASSMRIVQFHYPRAVDNDPLLAPVLVKSVDGNMLILEDGRAFLVSPNPDFGPLAEIIEGSESQVDIGSDEDGVVIFAKHRGWLCGTPWTGLIEIPLIPDDVPLNRRAPIGRAVELSIPMQ